jgi:transposase-like protein
MTGLGMMGQTVRGAALEDEVVLPRWTGEGEFSAIDFWTTMWTADLVALDPGTGTVRTVLSLAEWLAACGSVRWPDGFVCPECVSIGKPRRSSRGLLVCRECQRQASVLAGTILHRTRTPLRTWFLAACQITSQKYGANALGLQRDLGLKSYQTAWAWLHEFRRAMVRPEPGSTQRDRRGG